MNNKPVLKRLISNPDFSRLLILILMFALTAVLQRNFFAPRAIVRNIDSFTPLILMTMGQAVVIISGGLDLSVGTALSLMTCVLTSVMKEGSDPPFVSHNTKASAPASAAASSTFIAYSGFSL